MVGRIEDKVAIVTGGADGIGEAVVKRFLAEGASVLAVDANGDRLHAVHGVGERLALFVGDVCDANAPAEIVQAAVATFGKIDILVNNAGICHYADALDTSDELWDRMIGVNLTAMFRISRAAIPALRAQGSGRIINSASVLADRAFPQLAAYVASKHGVAGLTKTLALELGRYAITANYILPGAVLTGLTRPIIEADPGVKVAYDNMAVLNRMAMPEELASAVLFLASNEAAFITGHGLVIDGGTLARV